MTTNAQRIYLVQRGLRGAKGDPGSPGEGYQTRAAMASRLAPAVNDDVYLTEAGREGKFVVDLASNWTAAIAADTAQGLFVPSTADATKVYRRVYNDEIHAKWFGGTWNGIADDSATVVAAIAAANAINSTDLTAFGGSAVQAIRFPFVTNGIYMGTTTLTLTNAMALLGGSGGGVHGQATVLRWGAGCIGILINAPNCWLDGLSLIGPFPTGTATEGEFHGVKSHYTFGYGRLYVQGWQGDGVHVNVTQGSGGDTEGNANSIYGQRLTAMFNRNGLSLAGNDANAGYFGFIEADDNRQCGVLDASGLGNGYGTVETSSNGVQGVGTPCCSFNNGHVFTVALGQATGASTNGPPSTATSNTWWVYWKDLASAPSYAPQWTTGQTWREGGSVVTKGSSNFTTVEHLYAEPDQPPLQTDASTFIKNGAVQVPIGVNVRYLKASQLHGAVEIGNNAYIVGNVTVQFPIGGFFTIDASIGGQVWDPTFTLKTGNVFCEIDFSNSGGVFAKQFCATSSQQWVFNNLQAVGSFHFQVQNADVATLDTAGLKVVMGTLGYGTGVGGTVTQATSKSTGVTLNKASGQITMNGAALAASTSVAFTLTNSQIAAADTVIVTIASGATTNSYLTQVEATAAGSCRVQLRNVSAGSLSEAVVLNFAVIKAVNA